MTGHAVCTERHEVFRGKWLIDLQVAVTAGVLIERRSISIYMAIFTGEWAAIRLRLVGRQLECNCVVVKGCGTPTAGIMAGAALITQRASMSIILGMAGGTIHWRTFELSIDMAACAGNLGMFPVKMERELRVVHCGGLPAIGGMAGRAIGPKLTVVGIVRLMAGETILRGGLQVGEGVRVDVTG
mgnify:CR=1 FL=1